MSASTERMLQFFIYQHLPLHLQSISKPFCSLAEQLVASIDGPEATVALRKLLEAKDCAVRAVVEAEAKTTWLFARGTQPDEALPPLPRDAPVNEDGTVNVGGVFAPVEMQSPEDDPDVPEADRSRNRVYWTDHLPVQMVCDFCRRSFWSSDLICWLDAGATKRCCRGCAPENVAAWKDKDDAFTLGTALAEQLADLVGDTLDCPFCAYDGDEAPHSEECPLGVFLAARVRLIGPEEDGR